MFKDFIDFVCIVVVSVVDDDEHLEFVNRDLPIGLLLKTEVKSSAIFKNR